MGNAIYSRKDILFPITLIASIVVSIIAVLITIRYGFNSSCNWATPGQIGDTFGITAPILNFAGAIFVYRSFIQQRQINEEQSARIEENNKEQAKNLENEVLRQQKIRNFEVFLQILNKSKDDYSKFTYRDVTGYYAINTMFKEYEKKILQDGDNVLNSFHIGVFFEFVDIITFLCKKLEQEFFEEDKNLLVFLLDNFYRSKLKNKVDEISDLVKNIRNTQTILIKLKECSSAYEKMKSKYILSKK